MKSNNFEKFMKIPFKKRTDCAVCGEELGKPLINLPNFPLVALYTKERINEKIGCADQNFHYCERCGHGQLSNAINPEILYSSDYFFQTTSDPAGIRMNDCFISFIENLTKNKEIETIIEFGCNDLYLLNNLKKRSKKLMGVDPSLKDRESELSTDKIRIIGDFIENINIHPYIDKQDNLVISSHTLEHIENPRKIIKKLFDESNEKTLFIFQFPCLESIINESRFCQIFHEHLHYFSLPSFLYLLNEVGGELIDYKINSDYPMESLLVAFKKSLDGKINHINKTLDSEKILEKYDLFCKNISSLKKYLYSLSGEKIYGYGASLLLPTLSYHLKSDFSFLECIFDDDKRKNETYFINLPVQIKNFEGNEDFKTSNIFITALNHLRPLLIKSLSLNPKRVILPFNNL